MNARGTRRPHVRRPRSKPVRISRGGGKKSGCPLLILQIGLGLSALGWAVTELVT